MFRSIKESWKLSRADRLRKELDDTILRLNGYSEAVNSRVAQALGSRFLELRQKLGPPENISDEGKEKIRKLLIEEAKKTYELDMGAGYGLALLSMYYESQILPGPDADHVRHVTDGYLQLAIKSIMGPSEFPEQRSETQAAEGKTVLSCRTCQQKIRLPRGRSGTVVCPNCKTRFNITT